MKKCEKCGYESEFIEENYGSEILSICPECYAYERRSCSHEKYTLVKYWSNGGWAVRKMCSGCYKMFDGFISHKDCGDIEKIKVIEKEKHDRHHSDILEVWSRRINALVALHEDYHKTRWFNEHDDYLKSTAWRQKREEVLKRDNYLCQACLKKRATEVHHLSYDHWKNEPLYELISVCDTCHKSITEIDRKNAKIA